MGTSQILLHNQLATPGGGQFSNNWNGAFGQAPGAGQGNSGFVSSGGGNSGMFGGLGGVQNQPNIYNQQGAGFGGYNAGMANMGSSGAPNWMTSMLTGGTGGAYGAPVGAQQNPYSGYNLTAMTPNQALGQQSSQMGYLQSIAGGQGAGAPVNQTPAWNAMVGAQNYNIQQGADNLAEQFNNGGGLFSNAYGAAQGQYQEQAKLGQNAQLTSASTQAMQQAMQNQMGAAGQLSSQGYGALTGLSNQGLQATQMNQQNQLALEQMGLTGSMGQSQLGIENLQAGNTLGNSSLLANQNQLTAAYQNWYNSQPQNNPLLSMMYAGATGYPQLQQSTYNAGSLGSLLGGLGTAAGGAAALGLAI